MGKVRVHDVLFHTFLSLLCCQYLGVIFKYDVLWMESYSYIMHLVLCMMTNHFQP
jgi:hypothetical protein